MKALILHGPRDLRYESAPDPVIEDSGDVIVKMKCCGICGSDLHFFHGDFPPNSRRKFGVGHEAIGEVVEKGSSVGNLNIGDKVMLAASNGCGKCASCLNGQIKRCEKKLLQVYGIGGRLEGCQAEGIRVPAADFNAARVPDGISDEQAILLTDNLPTAYEACLNAGIRPGKSVAVIGLGPIGLMAVELAFVLGAATVFAVDLVPERREVARKLGAQALAPDDLEAIVREKTRGLMVDCVIEAAGGDATTNLALSLVGIGGTVSILGVNSTMKFSIPRAAFVNGVSIRANFLTEVAKYWQELVPLLQGERLKPERFVTHRSSLQDGVDAYHRFDKREGGALKTILCAN